MAKNQKDNNGEEDIEKALMSYKKAEKTASLLQNIANVTMNIGKAIAIGELSYYFPELGQSLISALSAMSDYVVTYISDLLTSVPITKSREKFFEQLAKFNGVLSPEKIEEIKKSDLIIEIEKTLETVDRCTRDEKINFMANLLGKYFFEESNEDTDQFEEFLYHLTILSFREIEILVSLYQIEKDHDNIVDINTPNKNLLQARIPTTNELLCIAPEKWNISKEEMIGVLTSLCRSGFLREITGSYLDYDGGIFYTTEYFEKFLSYILSKN